MKILRDFNKKVGLEEWDDEPAQASSVPAADAEPARANGQDDSDTDDGDEDSADDAAVVQPAVSEKAEKPVTQPAPKVEEDEEDDEEGDDGDDAPRSLSWRKWAIWGGIVAVMIVAFVMRYYCTDITEGVETGVVTHVEKRGLVFKTYEGQIISFRLLQYDDRPYVRDFNFSIPDASVARALQELQGTNQKVRLRYKTYYATLPWRGASKIIVTGFDKVNDSPPATTTNQQNP